MGRKGSQLKGEFLNRTGAHGKARNGTGALQRLGIEQNGSARNRSACKGLQWNVRSRN